MKKVQIKFMMTRNTTPGLITKVCRLYEGNYFYTEYIPKRGIKFTMKMDEDTDGNNAIMINKKNILELLRKEFK